MASNDWLSIFLGKVMAGSRHKICCWEGQGSPRPRVPREREGNTNWKNVSQRVVFFVSEKA